MDHIVYNIFWNIIYDYGTGYFITREAIMIYMVRTAFTISACDEREVEERLHSVLQELCMINKITLNKVQSIIFSQTSDITHLNPAEIFRRREGAKSIALFCTTEPQYVNSLPETIRMLVFFKKIWCWHTPQAVYKYGAEVLRPDLQK